MTAQNHLSIQAAQQELLNNFALLGEWMERYRYIIDLGNQLEPYPEQWRNDVYLVKGCLSKVWMHVQFVEGKLHINAISDSAIVSGLIAIVLKIYNQRNAKDILATPPDFIKQLGLDQHLSPTRNNGLYAMLTHIFAYAKQFQKESSGELC